MSANPAVQTRTNRLIDATSPYLLQHAHNPVDWFPWGPEALDKARREDKPIFLSIGYSACHWCHVMERESFENEEIAALLNEHFVPIKVDREERPDLDEIYMNATLLANQGQGGWPMSVFLTPEQKPFFAGTYFPPRSAYGRPGFKDLLQKIIEIWRDHREHIEEHANDLVSAVHAVSELEGAGEIIPESTVMKAADALAAGFDRSTGGIRSGFNKFPPSMALSLMLRAYCRSRRTDEPKHEWLDLVDLTLDHMARGGIYDHLGGGIHRYSTDPDWLVPHFEKMLYDQALVSAIYLEGFQVMRRPVYAHVARHIFEYVLRDLQASEGAFYSARDADSEGVEGKYYVWTRQEVMSVLGPQLGALFCSYYDVSDAGDWEGDGKSILHAPRDLQTVARLNEVAPEALHDALCEARAKLLAVRDQRPAPGLDDKVLVSWNALMISSLARGSRVLGDPKYAIAAGRAADFILQHMTENGRLLRTYRQGRAHTPGYLDDYAFFVEALLDLYEATFERRWLEEAMRLTDLTIEHFWDHAAGAFFFTADDAEPLLVRTKDNRDGEIPSGNSVALRNLLRLALILDRPDLHEKAEGTMRAFAPTLARSPLGFERFLAGVDFYHTPPRELVIAGQPEDNATQALINTLTQVYDPNLVTLLASPHETEEWLDRIPLLRGKAPIDGKAAAYLCRGGTCRPPITNPEQLQRELQSD